MSDRFSELVGEIDDPQERERLLRVHELLLSVEPPAELLPIEPPRRSRPVRMALLAAALAALALGSGYLLGARTDDRDAVRVIALHGVGQERDASASISLLPEDAAGNWPLRVVVRGLEPSRSRSDWYELWLTRDGKPARSCGRFTVSAGENSVTFSVPYRLKSFDGWIVTRRGSEGVLLTT